MFDLENQVIIEGQWADLLICLNMPSDWPGEQFSEQIAALPYDFSRSLFRLLYPQSAVKRKRPLAHHRYLSEGRMLGM